MTVLSLHEAVVWWEFQHGLSTSEIAEKYSRPATIPPYVAELMGQPPSKQLQFNDGAYVSRVLNRAREKIRKTLTQHAESHRLDVESIQDYNGLLIGFDYQTASQVYIVFTLQQVVVWYTHHSYAGKLCAECPKESECRDVLDKIMEEYGITLREDQAGLPMTRQSTVIFYRLAAKEIPRYKRRKKGDEREGGYQD